MIRRTTSCHSCVPLQPSLRPANFGFWDRTGFSAAMPCYGKPTVATRFKPGQSGNPRGRPRGAKKKTLPHLAEERLKTLVIEEAYRTIPIIERGQCINVPMIQAVFRSLAMNAVKGNNRSAQIFSTLVSTTEAANRKLAADVFGNFFGYRQKWQAEIARCKRLGLKELNPIPHPDDIILDTKP